MIKNKKRPKQNSDDSQVKVLGCWLNQRLQNFKNEEGTVYNNSDCKKLFEKLMDEFPEIFRETKRQRTE